MLLRYRIFFRVRLILRIRERHARARRRKVFCRREAADARPDDERRLIVIGQFPVSSLLMNSFLWSDVSHEFQCYESNITTHARSAAAAPTAQNV